MAGARRGRPAENPQEVAAIPDDYPELQKGQETREFAAKLVDARLA